MNGRAQLPTTGSTGTISSQGGRWLVPCTSCSHTIWFHQGNQNRTAASVGTDRKSCSRVSKKRFWIRTGWWDWRLNFEANFTEVWWKVWEVAAAYSIIKGAELCYVFSYQVLNWWLHAFAFCEWQQQLFHATLTFDKSFSDSHYMFQEHCIQKPT